MGQIAFETGWPLRYILDKLNVVQLALMTADMPHYVPPRRRTLDEQIAEIQRRTRQRDKGMHPSPPKSKKGLDPLDFFANAAVKD